MFRSTVFFPIATDLPPTIDPVAAARWALAAPARSSPWLHEEVARRMQQRLDWIRLPVRRWAHWAPSKGGLAAQRALMRRYRDAQCFAIEPHAPHSGHARDSLALPWWKPARWTAPATRFSEPEAGSLQMLWTNMALHMAADPQALLARWHELLAPNGFLMFSCLGPDTARELREVYRDLGWGESGHTFTDMHDWGDMLLAAGFAEPVMDMERIVLTWSAPQHMLAELRELGRNLHVARFAGLRTRGWRERLAQALGARLAHGGRDGRLALTFEIIYGHALKGAPRSAASAGRHAIALSDMRAMLGSKRAPPR